jgi:pimeloyl-ACP methyl ester carboxylesterase
MAWTSVVAVGQSWGANVVLELAARYPRVVAGAGLIDGGFLRLRDEFATWPDAERALTPPTFDHTSLIEIEAMMRSHMNGFPDSGIEAQLSNFEVASDGRVRNRLRLPNHLAILRNLWDHDPDATGRAVSAPIQVIAVNSGRKSKQERVSVFEAATDAEVHWREGHHDIHAQQPELVADLLLQLARRASA